MARRRGGFGYIISVGTTTRPAFKVRWHEGSRHKQQGGFKTRTDAAEALARIRVGLGDGTLVERRRAGIGFDAVAQEWLRLHSSATLRSHDLNAMNYRIHVAPFFGDCPLAAVTATRILELRAKLQAKMVRRRRRGADGKIAVVETETSPRMVNLILALVRSILRFAVANGHIATAPTDRIGRGKLMLPVEKAKLAPPIERPQDVGRVLEAIRAKRPDRHALFATLVYTGIRKGEACGLTWSDVDLGRRIINVRRSYDGLTKSGRHREVPLPSALVDILDRHRLVEPYQRELVFPNDRGGMYTKNGKLEDVLRAALASIGLARIRLHDLRHVYGSHFVMAGGSIYDLQRNLGHHSVAFTAEVYGHLSQDHRVKESDRLSGLFAAPAASLGDAPLDAVAPIADVVDQVAGAAEQHVVAGHASLAAAQRAAHQTVVEEVEVDVGAATRRTGQVLEALPLRGRHARRIRSNEGDKRADSARALRAQQRTTTPTVPNPLRFSVSARKRT